MLVQQGPYCYAELTIVFCDDGRMTIVIRQYSLRLPTQRLLGLVDKVDGWWKSLNTFCSKFSYLSTPSPEKMLKLVKIWESYFQYLTPRFLREREGNYNKVYFALTGSQIQTHRNYNQRWRKQKRVKHTKHTKLLITQQVSYYLLYIFILLWHRTRGTNI